jgi:hypothetical protein
MIASLTLFALGVFYGSFLEHFIHKYLFHRLGRKRGSIFSFHLRGHHLEARRNGFVDKRFSYREALGMPIVMVLHSPVLMVSPYLYAGMTLYGGLFVAIHNMLHHFPHFSKKYFWWHWNHHMRNQNKSFNVVIPVADIILGTLESNDVSGE